MEAERDQLRVILESREASIGVMEISTKEMVHRFDKMKEENNEMKRQLERVKEVEKQGE
jgi:predicted phage gp36 major capsid-like protein